MTKVLTRAQFKSRATVRRSHGVTTDSDDPADEIPPAVKPIGTQMPDANISRGQLVLRVLLLVLLMAGSTALFFSSKTN